MPKNPPYTCREYRSEMILLALKKRLADPGLSEAQRRELQAEVRRLEIEMGLA
jgi:hypothetical protein